MVNSTFRFIPRSPTELSAILERFERQIPTWQDYLCFLAVLPDFFLRLQWNFKPGTEDEIDEYGRLLWLHDAKAEWLDYLETKSQSSNSEGISVPPDLANSEKAVVEVRAKLSKAVLDLARTTFERVPDILRTPNRPTPESIWFAWEVQNFENMVWHSGLITGQATKRESKEFVDARCRELAKVLERANPKTLPANIDADYADELLTDLEALLCAAYAEAVDDICFRNSRSYIGFQRALRAWSRECRNHSFWILSQFENGRRLPGGRNAKRDPNRVGPNNVT